MGLNRPWLRNSSHNKITIAGKSHRFHFNIQWKDYRCESVKLYRERANKTNEDLVIRAWLQAFKGYVEGTVYCAPMISAQINACKENGGPSDSGFLLWNAANNYTDAV